MKIILNPSPMNDKISKLNLDKIDMFILNEIEASQITGSDRDDEDILITSLKTHFPNAQIVLTLGSDGSYYIYKDKIIKQDIYKVDAVDTTAAGDTFTGYFFSEIMKNEEHIAEALKLAARAASITVSRQGAAESIPVYSEL